MGFDYSVAVDGRSIPCSNNCVLGPKAVDGAILHAKSDHPTAFPILHQQVQGKVLYKVTCVVPQGLVEKCN